MPFLTKRGSRISLFCVNRVPAPRLYKTIFLAQFTPKLSFFANFRSAAAKLTGYPHWTTDINTVTMRDFDNRCSVTIGPQTIGFSQDSDDTSNELKRLIESIEILPKSLDILDFARVGFRRQYLVPFDAPFETLLTILNLKLLSQNDSLVKFLPRALEDLLYRLDLKDAEDRFHITVGPLRRSEIPRWIQFEAENHLAPDVRQEQYLRILASYPNVSTLIDIDMYRGSNIPSKDVPKFIELAQRRTAELADKFHNYLFTQEVERDGKH